MLLQRDLHFERELRAFKTRDRSMLLHGVLINHQTKSYDQAVALLDELMNMDEVKQAEDWGKMTRISDYYK